MNKNIKVAVIMGGHSCEREISLLTGKAVVNALRSCGFSVITMDIEPTLSQRLLDENISVVFNALHGAKGEDGKIQGMLDLIDMPYTGSSVLTSAVAMNKIFAKKIFIASGLPTPNFEIIKKGDKKAKTNFAYPIVVKPSSCGSACGVSIVDSEKNLKKALSEAFKFDDEVLIEEYIDGRELTVGIFDQKALPIIEIIPKNKFYDYEAKYTDGLAQHKVPAVLPKDLAKKIQNTALEAHKSLKCRDYSRVDIKLNTNNEFFILEVNTLPGFTNLSLFPEACKSAGIEFPDLVERLINMALKRGNK